MTFPTIPTVAAGRVLTAVQADTSATRTFPNLSSLTKNSGDILVAIIVGYQSSLTSAIFSAWGASFTEIRDIGVASQHCVGVAYKVSNGSETGTFTVTQGGTVTGHAAMILLSIPGGHATTAPEVSAALATGTSAAADPAALDPAGWAAEDTLWISVLGSGETATTGSYTGVASAPTNYGNYADTGISADVVGGVEAAVSFRQLNASSEDVGTGGVDTSNARNCAFVIAIRPAPADILLIGSSAGVATAAGVATTEIRAAGASAGAGTAAGALTTQVTLVATVAGVGGAASVLTTEIRMAASAAGLATALASMSSLVGAIAGAGGASASLTTEIRLSGASAGAGDASAAATTVITLAGSAAGVAAALANLATEVRLAGASAASSAPSGTLTTEIRLASVSAGLSDAAGNVTTEIRLVASAPGQAGAQGALTGEAEILLAGSAAGASDALASLLTEVLLAGASGGTGGSLGSLTFSIVETPATILGDATVAAFGDWRQACIHLRGRAADDLAHGDFPSPRNLGRRYRAKLLHDAADYIEAQYG